MRTSIVEVCYYPVCLMLLLMMGCTTGSNGVQPDFAQSAVPTQATATLSATSQATTIPEPTFTAVAATPGEAPSAELPAAEQTSRPLITRTPEEEMELLIELLQPGSGCDLPCWWAIVPGQSSLETTKEELAEKGFRVGSDSVGMRGADNFGVFIEFETENDIIQALQVGGDYLTDTEQSPEYSRTFAQGWHSYGLGPILERY